MATNWISGPLCDDCWNTRHPGQEPYRFAEQYRDDEQCCICGRPTRSGIYDRVLVDDLTLTPTVRGDT